MIIWLISLVNLPTDLLDLEPLGAHMETAAWLILFLESYGNCRVLETNTRLWFLEHFSVTLSPCMTKADVSHCFTSDGSPSEKKAARKSWLLSVLFRSNWSIFSLMEGRHPHVAAGTFSLASSSNLRLQSKHHRRNENTIKKHIVVLVSSELRGQRCSTPGFFFWTTDEFLHRGGETRTGRSKASASRWLKTWLAERKRTQSSKSGRAFDVWLARETAIKHQLRKCETVSEWCELVCIC